MVAVVPGRRSFLFLQGPHGRFFHLLGQLLADSGAHVERIGFNQGDRHFWPDRATYTPFQGSAADWPDFIRDRLEASGVTDLVVYGDSRPLHAKAVAAARRRGATVHCFEEGYLRPYWITYERGGTNGNSRLMDMDMAEIAARLGDLTLELPDAPPKWGAILPHILLGAVYHGHVLLANRNYPNFRSHREVSVAREAWLHLKRLMAYPFLGLRRRRLTLGLELDGAPYHLVLMQLAHDASLRHHSSIGSQEELIDLCLTGFAAGAPGHHRLVFKLHPLEDGREPIGPILRRLARRHGLTRRVLLLPPGKLGPLLDNARSVVTVNSTSAQQALWRGLPVKVFGRAVYAKPEFVSDQSLEQFFRNPRPPDPVAYRTFRRFLLATSQVPGAFYTRRGRAQAARQVVDMMLAAQDPYDSLGLCERAAARPQHMRLIF